ncbi:hypothetical protein [Ensifer sp. 4252]|uniref:hypothetical protein n=1 Tax=Ensifer sp. 4252 TaxID=3373915 RepID=UPI003D20CA65
MRMKLVLFAIAAMTASVAQAGSQSSNSSSNSSSNNGVVRERIVETYCEDGYCQRYVRRQVFRDDWQRGRAREWLRDRDDDD